jgi:hypothetical protein
VLVGVVLSFVTMLSVLSVPLMINPNSPTMVTVTSRTGSTRIPTMPSRTRFACCRCWSRPEARGSTFGMR